MALDPKNNQLLDFVYNGIDEGEWHDALDIVQNKHISQFSQIQGLFNAKINFDGHKYEVRLKLHPDGKYIQWLECTCPKNRRHNQICTHIAALIIYISQQSDSTFKTINATLPFAPQKAKPKKKNEFAQLDGEPEEVKKAATSRLATLSHFLSQVEAVKFLPNKGIFRIIIENQKKEKSQHDLSIDEGVNFILANPSIIRLCAEEKTRSLALLPYTAACGQHYIPEKNSDIYVEKILAIEFNENLAKKLEDKDFPFEIAKLKKVEKSNHSMDLTQFILLRHKDVEALYQGQYLVLPEIGFINLDPIDFKVWQNLPAKKILKDDEFVELIETGFDVSLSYSPVYLAEELATADIMKNAALEQVNVINHDNTWFYLDPIYHYHNAQSISMVELVKFSKNKKQKYFRKGNTWYEIPDLIKEWNWEEDGEGKYLKTSNLELFRLQASLGAFDKFVGAKDSLKNLFSVFNLAEVKEPPSLGEVKLNLRSYQSDGLKWLWWLKKNNLHGLLADEMGLGKTHQAMALLAAMLHQNPQAYFLVISPTTVLDHWYDKIVDFAPTLNPKIYHGHKRFHLRKEMGIKTHTLITSYGILLRDIHELSKQQWDVIILDEAHFVKNNKTATYTAACQLRGNIRVCLTGTPIENNLFELKNIFDFLLPGYLGSDSFFRKEFVNPITQEKSQPAELRLQKLIHPFKLRRVKKEVLPDLPEKVEDIRHCGLSSHQASLYREIIQLKASGLIDALKDDSKSVSYLHVFAILTLLKQVCDHPLLISKSGTFHDYESGKFELAKELISEALGSGHKIVIFSQYLGMLEIFSQYLKEENIEYVSFTGSTKNRGQVVKDFNENPHCKIFLGSLLAGGVGIDLTSASVVIHYDRWWNASKENQASDRVHRIGQNKNVQILKLVTKGTLEEKIDRIISAKQSLFDTFINKDEDVFKHLSRHELIDLMT